MVVSIVGDSEDNSFLRAAAMPASVYLWGLHMQLEKEILEGKELLESR